MDTDTIEGFRLSAEQRRLWRAAGSGRLRAHAVAEIRGPLVAKRLRKAVADVVERHEILRTSFVCLAGMSVPIQVIDDDAEVAWREASAADAASAAALVDAFLAETPDERDDRPSAGPRCLLVELDDDRRLFAIDVAALAADAAGLATCVAEIARRMEPDGEPLDEPLQYVQYSEWQHELLAETGDGATFWERALADGAAPHDLGFEREPRERAESFAPHGLDRALDPHLVASLDATAARLGVGLDAVLAAAAVALVRRLAGERDVEVAVGSDGRKYAELRDTVGPVARFLPLRLAVASTERFDALVAAVARRRAEIAALEEYFPSERDGAAVDASGLACHVELVDVRDAIPAVGSRFELTVCTAVVDRFRLCLSVERTTGATRLRVCFDPSLYDAREANAIGRAFVAILAAVAADASLAVARMPLLDAETRDAVLVGRNATDVETPGDACLHELFDRQAALTPDAIAVSGGGESLTYRELAARANRLAHRLLRLGVAPEDRVALCVDRSAHAIVGLLGILKAGCAYVPIDTAQPPARLALVREDAGPRVAVTTADLADVAASIAPLVVRLDADGKALDREPSTAPNLRLSPRSLAYVIYTSGSTGSPKGVMVEHASVVNLLHALDRAVYSACPRPVTVSVNAPLVFDASVKQLARIALGDALYLVPEDVRRDGRAMVADLAAHPVDVLDCTPSQLAMLVEAGLLDDERARPAVLLVGGEAIDDATWRMLAARPEVAAFDVYGPTECTVDATAARVEGTTPSIGRPLANCRVYVLDALGEPAPDGAVGELYIGGAGLARGYVGRPAATAERFVADPFGKTPGARLYRTGDLVRFLADGSLAYVGRTDAQRKIRGYRVELGEIEARVAEYPGVREAAALVRDEGGLERLVAYAAVRKTRRLDPGEGFVLPNGLAVREQNRNETEYLYDEIFEKRTYMRHGVALPPDAVVFDVGANVGMFSMFACEERDDTTVFAFEPIAPIFETLRDNVERYGARVRLFDYGLSDQDATTTFAYYPGYSMMSGDAATADAGAEVEVVRTYLANEGLRDGRDTTEIVARAGELLDGRFRAESVSGRLRTLSEAVGELGVERIDLLKIDVQRAELDVLRGIDDRDWPKIGRVVMEVHDGAGDATEGRVGVIRDLLEARGFSVVVEQDELLAGTDRHNLYAVSATAREAAPPARVDASAGPSPNAVVTPERLKAYLRERLPEYMVPAVVVLLDELPLTRNGKIDRAALAALEEPSPEAHDEHALATPVEEILAGLWSDLLKTTRVGPDSSFFELGGHSLLVMQLTVRLREAFGVDVALRDVFESPTLRDLAVRVERALDEGRSPTPPIVRVARDRALPLSFAQRRLWFLSRLEPDAPFYNCARSLRFEGALDVAALERALGEIVRRHEVLRTTFDASGPEPVQVVGEPAGIRIAVDDLRALSAHERETEARRLSAEEARRPFDLERGPLVRARLLRLSDDEHVGLFTLHHVVADGWSIGLLVDELGALYRAFVAGAPSPLDDLPVQYADYAAWQREWMRGEVLDRHLDYWRSRLAGAPAPLRLAGDRPYPEAPSYVGARFGFSLGAELSDRLRELSSRNGLTLFMTLLTGFLALLRRESKRDDLVVGAAVANRSRLETERLIGFFVNMLVVRVDLADDPIVIEALRRVREAALGAFAHQELPLESLVEALRPEGEAGEMPFFRIAFGLDNDSGSGLELPGVALANVRPELETVRYDVTLWMSVSRAGISGTWAYRTDVFDAATMHRLSGRLTALLAAMAADPSSRLDALDAETEEERAARERAIRSRETSSYDRFKAARPATAKGHNV